MPLRPNHHETAQLFHAFAEFDIRTTPSHVRRKSNRTFFARARHNRRLAFVILRIKQLIRQTKLVQIPCDLFVIRNRTRPHQHRLAFLVIFLHLFGNRLELRRLGLINQIVLIHTLNRLVRRNLNHIKRINLLELFRLGKCRTSHTR